MVRWRHNVPAIEWERLARRMGRTAAARANEARDTPIISPAWLDITSPLSAEQPARHQGPPRRVQVALVHVHRHHPRRHVGPALQLPDDTGSRARSNPVPPGTQTGRC